MVPSPPPPQDASAADTSTTPKERISSTATPFHTPSGPASLRMIPFNKCSSLPEYLWRHKISSSVLLEILRVSEQHADAGISPERHLADHSPSSVS
jgi:hypothetical protein